MSKFMEDYIRNIDMTVAAAIFAGLSVTMATLVIVDFISFASNRYRDRYLKEAAVELDDVLLQIPANRILDLSLAVSALASFLVLLLVMGVSDEWSWGQAGFWMCLTSVVAFPSPRFYLKFLGKQRLRKFNEQLEEGLTSMSSSLKAGFSITQAIEAVAGENKSPISIEFRLLLQEIRLGVSLEQALDNMCERLDSVDMELTATAIITARQTGGELTVILDRLASVIRERSRINNKLSAMTAQGRLQAIIIGVMPFVLMFIMNYVAADTMKRFYNSLAGIFSIVAVVILVTCGFLAIRKITNIDI
jgi:tight adherence protein B